MGWTQKKTGSPYYIVTKMVHGVRTAKYAGTGEKGRLAHAQILLERRQAKLARQQECDRTHLMDGYEASVTTSLP